MHWGVCEFTTKGSLRLWWRLRGACDWVGSWARSSVKYVQWIVVQFLYASPSFLINLHATPKDCPIQSDCSFPQSSQHSMTYPSKRILMRLMADGYGEVTGMYYVMQVVQYYWQAMFSWATNNIPGSSMLTILDQKSPSQPWSCVGSSCSPTNIMSEIFSTPVNEVR